MRLPNSINVVHLDCRALSKFVILSTLNIHAHCCLWPDGHVRNLMCNLRYIEYILNWFVSQYICFPYVHRKMSVEFNLGLFQNAFCKECYKGNCVSADSSRDILFYFWGFIFIIFTIKLYSNVFPETCLVKNLDYQIALFP